VKKDLKRLRRLAERQGWRVEPTGGGHLRWRSPRCGRVIFTASSPSDYRALQNILSHLKAEGLEV
jgi:predicted RNA binding protein YcfA (HicA-like mRNA interferase family)